MSTPDFNAADPNTWPAVMSVEQVAALYRRTVGGLKKACQCHRFVPAPFQKQPYLWRKVDIMRHLHLAPVSAQLRRPA